MAFGHYSQNPAKFNSDVHHRASASGFFKLRFRISPVRVSQYCSFQQLIVGGHPED